MVQGQAQAKAKEEQVKSRNRGLWATWAVVVGGFILIVAVAAMSVRPA
jgi:hypothetical protein